MPLRLEASAAGPVSVFGSGVRPIDWAAPGKASVVVPLFVYRENFGGGLFVNGHNSGLTIQPLQDNDADPPELVAFWQQVDPIAGAGDAIDEDAYRLADLWRPGRSALVRR